MRAFPLALSAALLAVACSGDDAAVRLHGRLLEADGSPAAGYRVSLDGFLLEGLHAVDTVTDAQGSYDLSATLRALDGDDYRLDVGFYAPDGAQRLELSVPAAGGEHAVPDQRLWDDHLSTTPLADGGVRATWGAGPIGAPATFDLSVYQATSRATSGLASWRAELSVTAQDLPAEIFEDRFASLQVFIGDHDPQFFCQRDLCVKWYSARVGRAPGSSVPVSRGATCTASRADGSAVPLLGRAGAPCALTDGYVDYEAWRSDDWVCGSATCADVRQVTVDLGAAVPLETFVVRYLYLVDDGAAFIEVSEDGSRYTRIATVDQSLGIIYERVHLDAPVTARFVRVTPTGGGRIEALAELSAF